MGDMADWLTDQMLDNIAQGGCCPDCKRVYDPEGPCGCDDDDDDDDDIPEETIMVLENQDNQSKFDVAESRLDSIEIDFNNDNQIYELIFVVMEVGRSLLYGLGHIADRIDALRVEEDHE